MKMKAIVCNKYGALTDLAVQQVQIPAMAPGQIRIQVETIGVNFPDALLVKGLYQAKPEVPFIPGLECAGMVEAVGEGVDHLAQSAYQYRPTLDATTFGSNCTEFLLENNFIPFELELAYKSLTDDLLIRIQWCFDVFLARIVIPLSRSSTFESITRSANSP